MAFQNGRYLICFNATTKDLITGDKQRVGTIESLMKQTELVVNYLLELIKSCLLIKKQIRLITKKTYENKKN